MKDAVLVLGAGGFVGSHLVRALCERGRGVIAASRSPFQAGAPVESHVGELREPSDYLPLLQRSCAVIHLASASTPGSSAAQPLRELEDNLRPALALLQAMQDVPTIPLIYVSSGGTLYGGPHGDAADESAPVSPRSYHGAGKIAAEHFIAAWCSQFAASATILRPSNLYGPGQPERAGFGIVPAAMGKILRGETLHVWGDGSAERDYLYIGDFVRLCLAVLDGQRRPGAQVLNACSGTSISLNALLDEIERVTGRRLARTYDPSRAVDVPRVAMRASLARRLYGWSPGTSLPEGLKRTWQWFSTSPH
ncbi:MAG TPA: NAD-dependent epimerase/dehydratase family protein [Rhodanobacteraceae bacterium]|jgi:UDP-glucose 4-epimerase